MEKLKVGILGSTGAAGLEFVKALLNHPMFEISRLYASDKNREIPYCEACTLEGVRSLPREIRNKLVGDSDDVDHNNLDFLCSALPSKVARGLEGKYAKRLPIISTTSAFRYEPDVPILITEVNPGHRELLKEQKKRGWEGWIAPGPNCTTVGLVMALEPLKELGIKKVIMSSYQSVSGAGYQALQDWLAERSQLWHEEFPMPSPDHSTPDAIEKSVLEGTVGGIIVGEEEKVMKETLKILGKSSNSGITPAQFLIGCQCVRVPVYQGHFETVFVETTEPCSPENVKKEYQRANDRYRDLFGQLHSSPPETFVVLDRPPNPIYDVNLHHGMAAVIGRIEATPLFRNGIQFQVLSNNLEKGAARGMIQVAEFLFEQGYLKKR